MQMHEAYLLVGVFLTACAVSTSKNRALIRRYRARGWAHLILFLAGIALAWPVPVLMALRTALRRPRN